MASWELQNSGWLGYTWQWYIHTALAVIILLYIVHGKTKFKYFYSYGSYIGLTIIFSIFYIPIFMMQPKNPANTTKIKPAATIISKLVGIKWEVRGGEILSVDRAGVIIGNHQSLFDVLGFAEISANLKKSLSISRKEVFYFWPVGLSAWLGGVVFIDRYNRKEANKILLNTCSVLLKHKAKLIIFPEGTRNRSADSLLPFKKGAFRVAISAQIPVLPIVFSPYYFIDSKKKHFVDGRIIIKVLDPITTEGLILDDLDELVDNTWKIMEKQYQMLKSEIYEEINKRKI